MKGFVFILITIVLSSCSVVHKNGYYQTKNYHAKKNNRLFSLNKSPKSEKALEPENASAYVKTHDGSSIEQKLKVAAIMTKEAKQVSGVMDTYVEGVIPNSISAKSHAIPLKDGEGLSEKFLLQNRDLGETIEKTKVGIDRDILIGLVIGAVAIGLSFFTWFVPSSLVAFIFCLVLTLTLIIAAISYLMKGVVSTDKASEGHGLGVFGVVMGIIGLVLAAFIGIAFISVW